MQAALGILIRFHDVLHNGGSQRCSIGVNKREMSSAFAVRVINAPNPAALMGEQFNVRIKGEVCVPRATTPCEICSLFFCDNDSSVYQFRHHLGSREDCD